MKLPSRFHEIGDYSSFGLAPLLPPPDDPVWDVWDFRQKTHSVHAQTRSIAFRWPERPLILGESPVVKREGYASAALCEAAETCAAALETHFGGRAVRLMLAELRPGGEVAAHVDKGVTLPYVHRCHVPVCTNPQVEFWIDHELCALREGIAYEIDNTRLHAVINRGATPRVHLICDILEP
jgi:hypothetical protein